LVGQDEVEVLRRTIVGFEKHTRRKTKFTDVCWKGVVVSILPLRWVPVNNFSLESHLHDVPLTLAKEPVKISIKTHTKSKSFEALWHIPVG